jgi:hypothetical protein
MEVVVHVNTVVSGGLIATMGRLIFCVMLCEAVATHPLAEVTVAVYVPGVVTFTVAEVPTTADPFVHEYDPPPVAVNVMDGVAHVKTVVVGAVMAAIGNGFTVIASDVVVAQIPTVGVNV